MWDWGGCGLWGSGLGCGRGYTGVGVDGGCGVVVWVSGSVGSLVGLGLVVEGSTGVSSLSNYLLVCLGFVVVGPRFFAASHSDFCLSCPRLRSVVFAA